MADDSVVRFERPEALEDPMTALLRSGAKRLIQQAVEAELAELLAQCQRMPAARGYPLAVSHQRHDTSLQGSTILPGARLNARSAARRAEHMDVRSNPVGDAMSRVRPATIR